MRRWRFGFAAVVASALAAGGARAGDGASVSPRGVGRAGAVVVSEDGAPALLLNPAGLARRGVPRASAGVLVVSSGLSFDAAGAPPDAPTIRDRSAAGAAPAVGAAAGLGAFVVGAAVLEAAGTSVALPVPGFGTEPADVTRLHPHRYAGLSLGLSRRTFAAGASWRALPWLAVGASATVADVALEERRAVWAGVPARDDPGDPLGDLTLEVAGRDRFVPGVAAGFLAAPASAPIEVAASIRGGAGASLSGGAALSRTRDARFPEPRLTDPRASLALPAALVVRAGLRYLSDRFLAEVGAELTRYPDDEPTWALAGIEVESDLGDVAELTELRAAPARRTRGAVRAALDVALIPGFAWATAGYAYASAGADESDFRPTFAAPASHTAALGLAGRWDHVGLTFGYARRMARAVAVEDGAAAMESAFSSPIPRAADGRYRKSENRVALSLDVAFP